MLIFALILTIPMLALKMSLVVSEVPANPGKRISTPDYIGPVFYTTMRRWRPLAPT